MSSRRFWCLVLAVVCTLSVLANATTVRNFYVSELFTRANNRTNPWTAAFSTQLNSGVLRGRSVLTSTNSPNFEPGWNPNIQLIMHESFLSAQGRCPFIAYNQVNAPFPTGYSFAKVLPTQLFMHPGPTGQYTRIIFTAPTRGIYDIEADFFANNLRTSVDVHMFVKGVEWWTSDISGDEGPQYYIPHRISTSVALLGGEKIEFVEGWGQNQEWSY
eukprot:CAMPEP_0184658776 /NCGR_PEP_ID=MMETSP0308-20130426/26871_1 /TAXON_ID=38269 /ORGANISM="Gloeochaete witrockiana, Strain SAG 46.84" /LENGTH=215 /DNA_ID=CAMNT_0027098035 /DNA_START=203 /DNA_END=847 /DNA_ORIENTATION=+